jgi:hypothetical protein
MSLFGDAAALAEWKREWRAETLPAMVRRVFG